eukprot:Tbor_TRINITY_DN2060_c0_g1::TRINITY_DN2060_c0_g1_i1::g.12067::m.12067
MLHDLVLGGISGTLCRLPTHPLDTCKTVAFSSDRENPSFIQTAKRIWKREGFTGFYRGVGITVIGAFPGNALYFVTYDSLKKFSLSFDSSSSELEGVSTIMSYIPRSFIHLGCGFGAETVSCAIWVPVDVVKERLQSQGPNIQGRYTSSLDGFLTCLRAESIRGLYKGYFSTLASFGPFSAIYFASYEVFDSILHPFVDEPFMRGMIAALCGNSFSAAVTNPLELIKTRLQIQTPMLRDNNKIAVSRAVHGYKYHSIRDGLRQIVKDKGVLGLWRGTLARVAFTGPNAALTMGMYRYLQNTFPE